VLGVEPPPDTAGDDPFLHPPDVVVVEAEAATDRLAVGEVEQLRRGRALIGELEQLGDRAQDRVRLSQGAIGETHPQVRQPLLFEPILAVRLLGLDPAGAEARLDQGGDGLDVRAHHDHVARLEGRVVLEQVQDRVADHLDLACAAVARVDLDAPIRGIELGPRVGRAGKRRAGRRAVGPDVVLDQGQQRRAAARDLMVVVSAGRIAGGEHELELARVLPPRRQQPVVRERVGGVVGAAAVAEDRRRRLCADPIPQRGRRVQHEQVHVAVAARERIEQLQITARQSRQPEQGDSPRQLDQVRAGADSLARLVQPLGRTRLADPCPHAAPQLRLPNAVVRQLPPRPVGVLASCPRAQHPRSAHSVAVVEIRDVANAREPPSRCVGGVAEVRRQPSEPGLADRFVDDAQERPHEPLGNPWIRVGVDAGRGRERAGDEPAREREVDVRADAVTPAG
jgi:hypothetical protein